MGAPQRYGSAVDGPYVNQQTGRAKAVLTQGNRIRHAPEKNAVTARLMNDHGQMKVVIDDLRSAYYFGEPLELQLRVKEVKDLYGPL